jgi:hypothetical protein
MIYAPVSPGMTSSEGNTNHDEKIHAANMHAFRRAIAVLGAGMLAAAFLFTPSTPLGQTGGGGQQAVPPGTVSPTDAEIQLLRQDIRAKRRQIVAANLPLTTEESAKFWPIYDQYIAETIKINNGRYALIKEYSANYASMTDAEAAELIRKWIDSDKAMVDLRLSYIPIVEKALPAKKASMFIQIDRRVQLMIDLELAGQIPLINPQ